MLGHNPVGGTEAVRGETLGDHLVGMHLRVAFLLANPGVPTQGYIPLGGMGAGWVVDTWGFTPVLPYKRMGCGGPSECGDVLVCIQGWGGGIREAWRHGHRVQGDAEWHGTQMGHGQSLVWVRGTQSRHSRAWCWCPSTHHHTPQRAVEHNGARGR